MSANIQSTELVRQPRVSRHTVIHTASTVALVAALFAVPEVAHAAPPITNPAPKAPDGLSDIGDTILSAVKWGALIAIVATGFIGAGAWAAGHWFDHQKSSRIGMRMVGGALGGALIYGVIFGLIMLFAKVG